MIYSRRLPAIFLAATIFCISVVVSESSSRYHQLMSDDHNRILVESYEALAQLAVQRANEAGEDSDTLSSADELLVHYSVQQALESFDEASSYLKNTDRIDHEHVVAMWEYATTATLILRHSQSQKKPLSGYTLSLELLKAVQEDITAWTNETKKMTDNINSNICSLEIDTLTMNTSLGSVSAGSGSSSGSLPKGKLAKVIAYTRRQRQKLFPGRQSDRASGLPMVIFSAIKQVVLKLEAECQISVNADLSEAQRDMREDDSYDDVIKNKKYVSRMLRIAAKAAFLRDIASQLSDGNFATYDEGQANVLLNQMIVLRSMRLV